MWTASRIDTHKTLFHHYNRSKSFFDKSTIVVSEIMIDSLQDELEQQKISSDQYCHDRKFLLVLNRP